jgi:hypothetical protein
VMNVDKAPRTSTGHSGVANERRALSGEIGDYIARNVGANVGAHLCAVRRLVSVSRALTSRTVQIEQSGATGTVSMWCTQLQNFNRARRPCNFFSASTS